ncbi:LysE family translocator [Pararhodobacter aggregans]|uniref:LysE family translocator n=1 Tax=Pararhodobacter aggregans TaxID=404875 RepID=UPI003A915081
MDITTALLSFSLAAALLTVTPGLDTARVLRTAAGEGPRRAMLAGAGVVTGVLAWGRIAALVLAVSERAYRVLRLADGAYLIWLGLGMVRSAARPQMPGCRRSRPRRRPTGSCGAG